MPGVKLFRRPADATFVLGALVAIVGGYLVHRWLSGDVAAASRLHLALEIAAGRCSIAVAFWLGSVERTARCRARPAGHRASFVGDREPSLLFVARRLSFRRSLPPCCSRVFTTADLAWNNAPHESTGLPPAIYDALRPDTRNETVALIRQRLAAQRAEPSRPRRADRHRLSLAEYLPDPRLRARVRAQSAAAEVVLDATSVGDTVAAPGQRPFSPLYPSYRSAFADLFGLRLIATGVPVEQIDKPLQARRPEFHRAHEGRLRLRKPARAAARDAGRRLEGRRFRRS